MKTPVPLKCIFCPLKKFETSEDLQLHMTSTHNQKVKKSGDISEIPKEQFQMPSPKTKAIAKPQTLTNEATFKKPVSLLTPNKTLPQVPSGSKNDFLLPMRVTPEKLQQIQSKSDIMQQQKARQPEVPAFNKPERQVVLSSPPKTLKEETSPQLNKIDQDKENAPSNSETSESKAMPKIQIGPHDIENFVNRVKTWLSMTLLPQIIKVLKSDKSDIIFNSISIVKSEKGFRIEGWFRGANIQDFFNQRDLCVLIDHEQELTQMITEIEKKSAQKVGEKDKNEYLDFPLQQQSIKQKPIKQKPKVEDLFFKQTKRQYYRAGLF